MLTHDVGGGYLGRAVTVGVGVRVTERMATQMRQDERQIGPQCEGMNGVDDGGSGAPMGLHEHNVDAFPLAGGRAY